LYACLSSAVVFVMICLSFVAACYIHSLPHR
jgi:hypothetical protein